MKKIDIYKYFEDCKKAGLSGEEAMREYQRDCEEYEQDLIEELEEQQGYTAYQQDMIDMHRFER